MSQKHLKSKLISADDEEELKSKLEEFCRKNPTAKIENATHAVLYRPDFTDFKKREHHIYSLFYYKQ